jgi:L-amino acid N-acyltransferase YncA
MRVRAYRDADWSEWLRMSMALFPANAVEELAKGMQEFRARSDFRVFLAERDDGSVAGFVEVGSDRTRTAASRVRWDISRRGGST